VILPFGYGNGERRDARPRLKITLRWPHSFQSSLQAERNRPDHCYHSIVHVPDVLIDPEYAPDIARAGGWRGGLAVPMIRNEAVIGVILVMRAQAGPFSHEQVELLKTCTVSR
jgi:GAF domain-containing protein